MTGITQLLEIANKAALEAGKKILKIYESGDFGADMKSDNSPLTLADSAAHKIILQHLEQTGLPVLSEEGKHIPFEQRKQWEYFWLVDPLDGTKEFIKKNGEFTVNIALIHAGNPVAGVIYAPCLNTLYVGSKETGVHKIEKEKKVLLDPLSGNNSFKHLLEKKEVTVVASRSHMTAETEAFIQQFENVQLASMGSSLKLMLLAENKADIYPRLAPTMEWDTAAGHAILKAADRGVYKTDLQSQLVYNKENLLNPWFIAF
ncbi:MAG: 3'(2'),5'-bisphosphate nucleotidase CysQ [Chitinophagaceae bacterium]